MALERTANAKPMSELSILTILVQAAAIVKNEDGDGTLHGYVELQGNRRAMEPQPEVELAVLESISDVLLLNHQILALTHNKRKQEPFVASVVTSHLKAESELELPAEYPIRGAVKVSSISATVVPNPDDRRRDSSKGDQSESGALGNIKQVSKGKSMWDKIKGDPIVVK
jgi:hypothetical protein